MKNLITRFSLAAVVCMAAVMFVSCGEGDDGGNGGANGAELNAKSETLSFTSGDYYARTIEVEAKNVAWEVTPGAEWVHVEKRTAEDAQDGTVVVTVDKNPGEARTSNVTLSGEGVESVVIAVSQKERFESEIIGSYVPSLTEYNEQMIGDLFLDSEWTTGEGPTLPLKIPGLGNALPWIMVDEFLVPMLGIYYSSGLDSFTFRDDGTFAATYHAVSGEFPGLTFAPEILEYPTEQSLAVLPGGVLSYYTENGMLYISIEKAFLNQVGAQNDIENLCMLIDAMMSQYEGLTLVSNEEYFALPFRYSVTDNVMKLSVDREMMLPYKPLLKDLLPLLLTSGLIDAETLAGIGIDPANPEPLNDFIEELFSNSTKLELGIRLAKK